MFPIVNSNTATTVDQSAVAAAAEAMDADCISCFAAAVSLPLLRCCSSLPLFRFRCCRFDAASAVAVSMPLLLCHRFAAGAAVAFLRKELTDLQSASTGRSMDDRSIDQPTLFRCPSSIRCFAAASATISVCCC